MKHIADHNIRNSRRTHRREIHLFDFVVTNTPHTISARFRVLSFDLAVFFVQVLVVDPDYIHCHILNIHPTFLHIFECRNFCVHGMFIVFVTFIAVVTP
jgi:hypothetical protein